MKINDFLKYKESKKQISMMTVYDTSFARILETTDIDVVLVGDSLAMTMHGYESTIPATMKMMALHTAAVSKVIKNKFIVADLPFMSFRKGFENLMANAEQLMRSGAHAVKLEGATGNLENITHLVDSGIPVMGHLGLTPQFINLFGGWKVQGKSNEAKEQILKDALALQKAGCFSLVLECVPEDLATTISKELRIPCIGIGAGANVDGQVLVLQDLLGMNPDFKPKFVRSYLDGYELIKNAVNSYVADVQTKEFPNKEESYL
ncbi:MAG: 3-methyl-2-oxobutanoate hydroxymethyltransferase [Bdellovibrionales bacterium]|nr:3-methyl-2-oxobutanoate hydroxymethyltransferase [Bdellovibrionales bacterium]